MANIRNMVRRLRSIGYTVIPPKSKPQINMADRLKELRTNHEYSLQHVADICEVSKAYMWELEQGRALNPGSNIMISLAGLYDVSIDFLVFGKDRPAPTEWR